MGARLLAAILILGLFIAMGNLLGSLPQLLFLRQGNPLLLINGIALIILSYLNPVQRMPLNRDCLWRISACCIFRILLIIPGNSAHALRHAGIGHIVPVKVVEERFSGAFLVTDQLVIGPVGCPDTAFIGGAVGLTGVIEIIGNLHLMLEPDVSAVTDTAVPRLIEDRHALGVRAQISMQIVQRLEVEQLLFMIPIHLAYTAVGENRLSRLVQLTLVQDSSVGLPLCLPILQHILRSGGYLSPILTVRLCRVQHCQVHGCSQIGIICPVRSRFRGGHIDIILVVGTNDSLVHDLGAGQRGIGVRVKLLQHIDGGSVEILRFVVRLRVELSLRDIVGIWLSAPRFLVRPNLLAAVVELSSHIDLASQGNRSVASVSGNGSSTVGQPIVCGCNARTVAAAVEYIQAVG